MEKSVCDLSNVYGYARLFVTLKQDGLIDCMQLGDKMYGWYCSNITAYNKSHNADVVPLESEIFYYKLNTAHVKPYLTQTQTIKALTLLEWNMDDSAEFSKALQQICEIKRDYAYNFEILTGYAYTNPVTSFSLCEETLDPRDEPEYELNPNSLVRQMNIGPKFIYISAPLRGDVETNIAYAKKKAREVFEEGHIPICPHLIFASIADPKNPEEDKKAMDMCLHLIDRCNEVRVYGTEWTEGMWQEIHYAEKQKIPIKADQESATKWKGIGKKYRIKNEVTK